MRQVLVDWNDTSRAYAHDRCIHELFEDSAAKMVDRVAVECGGHTLTYGELNDRANQLANHLIHMGVESEALVGLHLERSLDLIIGLLGILKAGCAYVPMDPSFPRDRLDYMMEDADISVLVTQRHLLGALKRSDMKVVCLEADAQVIQQQNKAKTNRPARPTNLAYTIYTSGSSGKPKGVAIEHRSVVNLLTAMQREPGFDSADVLVGVTTISFDIAALEIFLPLISGGRLVLATTNEVVDGAALAQLLKRSGATMLQATPSTWRLLLDANWRATRGFKMLCGGEALSRELANQLLEGGGELWNMYGPTETTIWSSVLRIERGGGPVLIGPPLANTQFYIVDAALEPVPIGAVGELLIGGEGLSRGYRNLPELTAQRFIQAAFADGGKRLYRTGDLARFRANGRIDFMGRLDFQVKVRGFRIELEEIEQVLARHGSIKDVAVVPWNGPDGDKRLVAYFIESAENQVDVADLRRCVREKLPEYMCPSFFVKMQSFPSTPNGKVDRKAFPGPESSAFESTSAPVAPQRELEVRLAAIWQRVLRLSSLGIDDNFFDLGGHSLLAAHLFAEIEKKLDVKLPLALLFQAPTVRQLADQIEKRAWKSSWNSMVPIRTRGRKPPLFLMHGAEGNVLLYRSLAQSLGGDQPVYALQSRGLDGIEQMEPSIERMAAKYVDEIESVQSDGPYYLGGYCLGGAIALEVAQRLRRSGKSVALLAMLESYNVRSRPPVPFPLGVFHKVQNLNFQMRNVLLSLFLGDARFFVEKFRIEVIRFKGRCEILSGKIANRFNPDAPRTYQRLLVREVNDQAHASYQPAPYDGSIVLVKAKGHFRGMNDSYWGWDAVSSQGVRVIEMPNYPKGSLNHPFVEVLAKRLGEEIDKTLQQPG
jgi:amino acid adenylation domain-containing protein